jgi:hypothetical protein
MKSAKPRVEILESRIAPATFTVTTLADSGAGSLRDALAKADASPGPDTIKFKLPAPPAHGENVILLTSGELKSKGNVTITGPGSGKLIIDANNASRVFDINDGIAATDSPATISGLSMVRGKTNASGGGIYSHESLTLNNVVVSQCSALIGGGVAAEATSPGAQVRISNSLIDNNSVTVVGGGLDVVSAKAIAIQRTIITGNTSTQNAGGVYAVIATSGTAISLTGCTINGNTALTGGGMFLNSHSTLATAKTTISGTTIAGNTSTGTSIFGGGGVFVEGGQTVISNSNIDNNSAVYGGGGIDANQFASLTIVKTTISGNQTTAANAVNQGGGGVFIDGSGNATPQPVNIAGSHIADNQSAHYGGGLLALNGIALTISGSTFTGNRAISDGGGVMTTGTSANKVDITVTGCTFSNNSSKGTGGGLACSGGGQISISSSTVTGNIAGFRGGGIVGVSTAATNGLILKNLTVGGNFAGAGGGGVAIVLTPDFQIIGGSFSNNTATSGGGFYGFDSSGSVSGITISGNSAGTGGGADEIGAGTINLQIAKVHGNTAQTDPDVSGTFTFV